MPSIDTPEFPDLFAEHFVGPDWRGWRRPRVAGALTHLLTRSTHPQGTAVEYTRVHVSSLDMQAWPRLKGVDTGKSPSLILRRNWRHAAVLALGGVDALEYIYGEDSVRHGLVRVTSSGYAEAGMLPEGVRFGRYYPFGKESTDDTAVPRQDALMYRTGSSMLTEIATPALFVEDSGKIYVPLKPTILEEGISLHGDNPWTNTSGVPIV